MSESKLRIRLLGPVSVHSGGAALALPRSRKVRALLAFLVLEGQAVARSRLCDMLWDLPNDPRGELRWCLSKLRSLLDDATHRRVVSSAPALIGLDLSDCWVDVFEVAATVKAGVAGLPSERLTELSQLFNGDLLDGMQVDGSPELAGWLSAQRHRHRTLQVAVLVELAARAPRGSDELFRHLDAWLRAAPFDERAHILMINTLVKSRRKRDADAYLSATIRAFELEGIDWSPLRQAMQAARQAHAEPNSSAVAVETASATAAALAEPRPRRVSVAVMPFLDAAASTPTPQQRIADGLTDDVITRLAKLRVLFVIARGSVYALGERGVGAQEAGRILDVQYVVSGSVSLQGGRISVRVELAETQDARIVWTDEIDRVSDDTFSVLDAVVNHVVATIAGEIESAECNRALLKPPSSLNAWEAYHRGLWHMYKFNGPDNAHAERFFRAALQLDPTFARAFAGLSFTHFQNAFLNMTPDRDDQVRLALATATHSLSVDERDPAAHWAMGRALWLNGSERESIGELERCIELSPNFALGHYTLGFVHSQKGDPATAIDATNYSRELSPFDPLQFAMLASRALAHVRLGQMAEAADWAVKATGRPNAHAHILAIAAECLALADRRDDARAFVARIRHRAPSYDVGDFLRAFRFDHDTSELFRRSARQINFDSRT